MSISVPQSLLSVLQASFDLEAKRVAKDVSKLLKVPEKDILQLVKQMPKIQLKVHNDNDISCECPVFLIRNTLLERCRIPCILGTGKCIHHQTEKEPPSIPETIQKLTRLSLPATEGSKSESYWCDEETKMVYTSNCKCVGYLNEDDDLELYEIENE
jgi:hypothetical protein